MMEIEKKLDSNKDTTPIKAVVLLSGGLDSAIAARLVSEQGIEVHGLNFHSPFCVCNTQSKNNQCGAIYFASKLNIPIKIITKSDDYLEIVKNPKFGYGKNLNPCIDCRIHILKKAKEYADEIGAQFLITGEVLGQRPKSQTLRALKTIEHEAGLDGLILRPLSAQLLQETKAEKEKIVDRGKFLNIQGRRRNIQVELGKEYKLVNTYCANGGCRLTDRNFARKLKDYLDNNSKLSMDDMKWLKIGRHFRFDGGKIICGRNESENNLIKTWSKSDGITIELDGKMGPTVIIFKPYTKKALEFASQIAVRYSDSTDDNNRILVYEYPKKTCEMVVIKNSDFLFNNYRI